MTMRARSLLIFAVALLVALAGVYFIRNLIDFPVYYAAGRSLLAGRTDLYAPDFARGAIMDFRYPPFFLVAFLPLWMLPYPAAAYLWYVFSILQIGVCVFALRKTASATGKGMVWLIVVLAAGQYLVMAVHYGNAHLLVTALLFAALYFALRARFIPSAALLALSITIKLTPIVFLPYFAVKRKWKLVLMTAAFLVAINLIPAFYFGFSKNVELLRSWYSHVVVDQEFHESNGPINLSLKGELRRYLTDVDYSKRVEGDVEYPRINIVDLSANTSDAIWLTVAGATLVLGLILVGRQAVDVEIQHEGASSSGAVNVEALEMGLMICLSLFAGPLTSKIYFISTLWPLVTVGALAFCGQASSSKQVRCVLIGLAALNLLLPLLPGRRIQRLLLVVGADFCLNCLLAALLVWVLLEIRRSLPQPAAESQSQDQ